jgi:hypothetical protein
MTAPGLRRQLSRFIGSRHRVVALLASVRFNYSTPKPTPIAKGNKDASNHKVIKQQEHNEGCEAGNAYGSHQRSKTWEGLQIFCYDNARDVQKIRSGTRTRRPETNVDDIGQTWIEL